MVVEDNGYIITHMGKTFKTSHFQEDLTSEECNKIRKEFYTKPSTDNLDKQIQSLRDGKVKIHHIYHYYFYDIMADCRTKSGMSANYQSWSINEFMQCDDLIRFAIAKIRKFPKVYFTTYSDAKNIKTVFRLSPSGTAAKLSNFPYKTVKGVLEDYNVNDNYYDFSCGWGVRLCASMASDVNYFGTDPNKTLVKSLDQLVDRFKSVTDTSSKVDIRPIGSEVFVPEWENKMGLAFSSPPYFDLEEYSRSDTEGQSIENYPNYSDWLEKYFRATMKNIKKYLIEDGHFLMNIKDIKNHALYEDCKSIIESEGFTLAHELDLKNINRVFLKQNDLDTDEKIMVFCHTESLEVILDRIDSALIDIGHYIPLLPVEAIKC